MTRHRDIPVIVTPADLRGGVIREVADAVRAGRARYVGVSEAVERPAADAPKPRRGWSGGGSASPSGDAPGMVHGGGRVDFRAVMRRHGMGRSPAHDE